MSDKCAHNVAGHGETCMECRVRRRWEARCEEIERKKAAERGDIARLGEEWAAKSRVAAHRMEDARYRQTGRVYDDLLTDWHELVRLVRERDEAWQRLRDAVEADEERKRIKAEAER